MILVIYSTGVSNTDTVFRGCNAKYIQVLGVGVPKRKSPVPLGTYIHTTWPVLVHQHIHLLGLARIRRKMQKNRLIMDGLATLEYSLWKYNIQKPSGRTHQPADQPLIWSLRVWDDAAIISVYLLSRPQLEPESGPTRRPPCHNIKEAFLGGMSILETPQARKPMA